MESLVSASVAQAVKTLVQPKEEAKDWELQLKREQERQEEERKRKEAAEAHLFTVIKVSCDKDLRQQIGRDRIFDLVDHEHVTSFRLPKQMQFVDFQRKVERDVGVPVAGQRFWLWTRRLNHTYRPHRPLNPAEEGMTVRKVYPGGAAEEISVQGTSNGSVSAPPIYSNPSLPLSSRLLPPAPSHPPPLTRFLFQVGQLRDSVCKAHAMDLRLFLEGTLTPPCNPPLPYPSILPLISYPLSPHEGPGSIAFKNRPFALPHQRAKDDILLFLKFYNPVTETLRYVGRFFVKLEQKPGDVREKVKEMCDLAPTNDILLFEELKFEPSVICVALEDKVTFKGAKLEDGDIVCVQHANLLAQEGAAAAAGATGSGGGSVVRYPDVPSFLEYARNRQLMHLQ
ncbi:unnamed protein product [Closterium sp. Naga37s-1]|nr:unnamed protein product [Closterium sp. Naga37s-1]